MSGETEGRSEQTYATLPHGEPEQGDRVRISYLSKRSGNVLERTGRVVSTEWEGRRLNFKVKEPGRDGLLWGFVYGVGGSTRPDDPPDLHGSLSRKTPRSKPHFESHYGDITSIEKLADQDGDSDD